MKKIFYVISVLISLPGTAWAAPNISGVSGNLTHGRQVTISGSGFGLKQVARPYVWDTIEDGNKNDPATIGSWGENTCSDGTTSMLYQRHSNSKYNVGAVFTGDTSSVTFDMNQGKTANTYYGGYWFYLGSQFDFCPDFSYPNRLANIKILRFYSTNMVNLAVVIHSGELNWGQETCPEGSLNYTGWSADDNLNRNAWHHIESEFMASGVNQANGVLRVWINGKLRINTNNLATNCSASNSFSGWDMDNMGFYDSWPENSCGGSNNVFHLDDVYSDTTWSRVFIGDASDCGNINPTHCTHREIQIPTAWSQNSITISANQGSFTSGQTVYLYVVDANGEVNPNGYPVTIGGGTPPDTLAPGAPAGLSVR